MSRAVRSLVVSVLFKVTAFAAASFAAPTAHAAPVPESGTVFQAGDVSLYYEIRGSASGTPFFMVNGGPGFDHTYVHCSDVWDTLAKRRKVVFYDQRGNGRSGPLKPGQSCTLADQVAFKLSERGHHREQRLACRRRCVHVLRVGDAVDAKLVELLGRRDELLC